MSNDLPIKHDLREIKQKLKGLNVKLQNSDLRRVLAKVLRKIRDDAKPNAPGELKKKFRVNTRVKGQSLRGSVKVKAPHAHLIELGWTHTGPKPKKVRPTSAGEIAGRPFLRPALDEAEGYFLSEFADALWAEILKLKSKT